MGLGPPPAQLPGARACLGSPCAWAGGYLFTYFGCGVAAWPYVYPADVQLVKDTVGEYHVDVNANAVGMGMAGDLPSASEAPDRLGALRQPLDQGEDIAAVSEADGRLGKKPTDPSCGGTIEPRILLGGHEDQDLERVV